MNKTIKKFLVAGLACAAFCGTTFAAPHGGNGGKTPNKAPAHQQVTCNGGHNQQAHRDNGRHCQPTPARHCEPVRHCKPAHPAPPPPPPHDGYYDSCNGNDATVAVGAGILGALLGTIIGACN